MDKISLALSTLLGLALVLMIAPSVVAMNRGKMLRNIAIWLVIILGLGLFYRQFGPGAQRLTTSQSIESRTDQGADADDDKASATDQNQGDDDQGYTPPRE